MKGTTIGSYMIQVYPERKKGDALVLSEFSANHDFVDWIENFLNDHNNKSHMEPGKHRMLKVLSVNNEENDYVLYGQIQAGEWNDPSELYHTETGESRFRVREEAELRKFYYMMSIPIERTIGFMFLQRIGNIGIKTQITDRMKCKFREDFPDLTLNINPVVSKDYIAKLISNAEIKSVTIYQVGLERDVADNLANIDMVSTMQSRASMAYTISSARGTSLGGKFKEWISRHAKLGNKGLNLCNEEFVRLIGLPESFRGNGSVELLARVGGHTKVFDISNFSDITAYYRPDSDQLEYTNEGHVTLDSIHKAVKDYCNSLFTELEWSWGDENKNDNP